MSDAIKWGLLTAGLVVLVGLVSALPFVEFINLGQFGAAVSNIVSVCGDAFQSARGLINCFLLPFGRTVLSGLMVWLLGKWALMVAIKIVAWTYHFIFRG